MTAAIGLRERKRAQTRRRLEEAAIGLALRDGLDNVTIDAISERAEVSRRTFFNYFDSKDDAILGVSPPDVSPETLTRHLARYDGSDLVESIIGLIIAVLGPSIDEPALHQSRLEVIRQHLSDAKVFKVGHRKVSVFIVGKTDEGDAAGLKTTAVET